MNFNWDSDTIRWYRQAEAYTGFFRNVAGLIAPRLTGYNTLCDIGCGVGLVDMALCRYINHITCIDINPAAIEALQEAVKDKNITNITPCLMDCNTISQSWDAICVSFFGSRDLGRYLPHCKKLIAVVGKKNQSELIPEKYRRFPKNTVEDAEQLLVKEGIPYSLTEAEFEFGQPFVSVEEAEKFVMAHSPGISLSEVSDFLANRLIETKDAQYPFSIPRRKAIGIFEIKGEL